MIITISGFSGCGKDTVGSLVAKELGLRHIRFSFKDEARKRGISLMELQKLASQNPDIDKEFDKRLVEEAEKGGCVVTTWLGSWMIKGVDFRVWLEASAEERAKRVANRDKMTLEQALAHVRERDENNIQRYKQYYGIDITRHADFNLTINTPKYSPEQIASMVIKAVKNSKR